MADKKKWFYELLQSEEVHEYFQEMLNVQTEILLKQIRCQQNVYDKVEVERLKREYDLEKNKRFELEEECRKLQDLLRIEGEKNKFLDEELKIAAEKYDKLQVFYDSTKAEKEDMEKTMAIYESRYRELDEIYSIYERLSQETKNRLRNVFKTESIYGFITACAEWRNVEGLWNFARRHVVEKEMTDTEELICIFEFMLQVYNHQESDKKYELLLPAIGDKFDSDRHTIMGIKTDGFVSRVRLPGIVELNSAKVIQKALIEI